MQLQLQELKLFATADLCGTSTVFDKQSRELNVCNWNSVYSKIFKFNRWESVKCFINGLGRLELMHLLALRKLKYCCKLNNCSNITMFHAFQCYKLSREYLTLLTKYSCGPNDIMFNINFNVIGDFRLQLNV